MMIATTGEMPVNYADVVDYDLGRTVRAGLTDRVASQLDQIAMRLHRALRLRVVVDDQDLELQASFDPVEFVEWHEEPDFIPGTVVRGIVLGPPDFSDVSDGIDWG